MRKQARTTHFQVVADNVTPVWLLPFWRLVKGEAMGDYAAAYRALPKHLPPSVRRPTVEETAIFLAIHGLV
ncbi:hypothetical protein [Agrobacterium pusense]|uniref:Uncharacterized protein n=1 Tax=Agrobacterium pusense TaxID=648995 RepID=A0AA44IYQ2_9HYPH|nr:hypothetical protein [Agrobacterium pusense]NRF09393.1 hypothetical protein [Agrobacterium pusense]NRF19702.1 hypothetical protein [Agrobacterium pusense]